jgi:hypothetical protein
MCGEMNNALSEVLFEQFCEQNSIPFDRIPTELEQNNPVVENDDVFSASSVFLCSP